MHRSLIGLAALAVVLSAGMSAYDNSIRKWQHDRDVRLRSPDSWLTLAGLFWLKPGENTIGAGPSNDFVLPKGSAPDRVGTLTLKDAKIRFTRLGGSPYPLSYADDKPTVIHAGTVSFYAIKRGDRFGIRAKDSASPVLKNFTGMRYFPINPALHFQAKFIPDARKIPILNIVGQTDLEESPGIVEFTYQGKTARLRPIYEDETLFFLFRDPTNKINTYQAGRMLNTPLPQNGIVDLDFNLSYNPPCTFTPYATCPLPPKENTMPFAVEAGEQRYAHGHADYAETSSR